MLITGENRFSQLKPCLAAAHHFLLFRQAAVPVIERIESAIRDPWERVCEEAELSPIDKNYRWGCRFFNPFSVAR
jgi:serine/threonine-protein kinase HipA